MTKPYFSGDFKLRSSLLQKKETQVAERSCTKIEYNLCMKQTSTERTICAIRMTKHTNNLLNLPPKNYHLCIEQHSEKTKVTFTQKERFFYTRKNHHVYRATSTRFTHRQVINEFADHDHPLQKCWSVLSPEWWSKGLFLTKIYITKTHNKNAT